MKKDMRGPFERMRAIVAEIREGRAMLRAPERESYAWVAGDEPRGGTAAAGARTPRDQRRVENVASAPAARTV